MDTQNKNRIRLTFSPAHLPTCKGFSLIEVLVAISLMAFLAVYLGAKTAEMATEDKFYKTCYMMEEIKEAIIGREGLYCNGVRQFTGYVSDMGNLPNLYYYLDEDRFMQKVTAGSMRLREKVLTVSQRP